MKIKESERGKENQGSPWMYRSASVAAAIAGVAALEVLYGCAGDDSVEELIDENVGEVSEALTDPGTSPCAGVVCPAADQCHDAGYCMQWSGTCSTQTNKPNGTGCNDGNPTTFNDVCTNGVCKGNTDPSACGSPSGSPVPSNCGPTVGTENLQWKSDGWGDSNFGSSYHAIVGIGSKANTGYDVLSGAKADAYGTIFGLTRKLLDMGAQATSLNGVQASRGWLEVNGQTVLNQSLCAMSDYHQTVSFFDSSADLFLVHVSAQAAGSLGLTAFGALSTAGISMNVTPSAQAWVNASASVGLWCVSGGVSGGMTLLKLALPSNGYVQFLGNAKGWSFNSDLAIQSLSGNLTLDINYCIGSNHPTIASWSGFNTSYPILHSNGCM